MTTFHGQSSMSCMPGKAMMARISDASRSPVYPYWLCRTYVTSKRMNCGTIAAISPASACCSNASAASLCAAWRSMKNETRTFASTTTLRTSDASSGLPRFDDRLHRIGRAVLDDALVSVECLPFGRDGDAAAADLPIQFVARVEVERVANFLRHRRLALAGDG